jgi:predicted amidohydrolase YtcJ
LKVAGRSHRIHLAFTLGLVLLTGSAQASDLLLIHGHVYTANSGAKWAEAIAITGDKIDAVGSDAEITKLRQPNTRIVDLRGKTVLPGFTDNHLHLWFGALALHGVNLANLKESITPDDHAQFASRIKAYAASHPAESVIYVRSTFLFAGYKTKATHAFLDSIVSDRPMVIHDTTEHALFVNGKTLALAGIGDRPLPNADENQFVERDAGGHPTGIIREGAMDLIERSLPDPPLADRVAMLYQAEQFLNSFGVTSAVAATGGLHDLENYAALRKQGRLTLRIRQAFGSVAVDHHLTPQFLADLEKARSEYHDDWIQANMVKFFMDGAGTAPLYTVEDYNRIVLELDRRNIHVMSHALSVPAAHEALDGLAAVEKANGPKDRRFRMEHASNLAAGDVARFGQLGMIPSMQPAFCCFDFARGGGSSPAKQSEWQSLRKGGATLVFSSDWPCSWPPSPLLGVQMATERELRSQFDLTDKPNPHAVTDAPDQGMSVEEAVLAYTRDAAYANFMEKKLGTLEAGKLADLVVLPTDIFTLRPDQIGKTLVTATVVGGKLVYGKL